MVKTITLDHGPSREIPYEWDFTLNLSYPNNYHLNHRRYYVLKLLMLIWRKRSEEKDTARTSLDKASRITHCFQLVLGTKMTENAMHIVIALKEV